MFRGLNAALVIIILVLVLVASGAVYTVDETQQVILTQFGRLVSEPIREPGLYFKIPFVQTANFFDKRLLQWDGDSNQIPTLEKRFIWVDVMARWRIDDPLKFMQSVGSETAAQSRLDDIIDASVRDIISSNRLVEIIRNSNRVLDQGETGLIESAAELFGKTALKPIDTGREQLSQKILERASSAMPGYGIELVDVRIKRVNYVDEVRQKVYERMVSERKRAAEQYRSEGQGKKAEIEGQMQKELNQIQSEAYKRAQVIKGEADAQATEIYASAYNKDPEFFSFIRTLETYQKTITSDTQFLLSTDNEFYNYLKGVQLSP